MYIDYNLINKQKGISYLTYVYVDDGAPFIKDKRLAGAGLANTSEKSTKIAITEAEEFCTKNKIDLHEDFHSIETKELPKSLIKKYVYG